LIASIVWGMTPSSAATTRITMSVTCAPRALMRVKASWPGVSRKVMLPLGVSTMYAPMCCVIPPNSPATTSALRIASSSLVFPWSTWPMTVTTGGLGSISAPSSVAVSMTVSSYRLTIFTSVPYSAASMVAVSASICWFIVTIMPIFMSLWISSDTLRFIFLASSDTEMTSIISMDLGTELAE